MKAMVKVTYLQMLVDPGRIRMTTCPQAARKCKTKRINREEQAPAAPAPARMVAESEDASPGPSTEYQVRGPVSAPMGEGDLVPEGYLGSVA